MNDAPGTPPITARDQLDWRRFLRAVRALADSEVGTRARLLFALLLGLMLAINGLNVVNSYVGRDFMTAIATRDRSAFLTQGLFYVLVFGACTLVAVLYRFAEERLALLWRDWLTRRFVTNYLSDHVYYRLREHAEVDNPDQRMAEDTRVFTTTTLSFFLMVLNGGFTILAFSGVLWSISPLLFFVAVAYAAVGSVLTFALGRPLIGLNYVQLDREAALRAALIHIRENAESVAILRREGRLTARVLRRIDEVTGNMKHIIAVNRNLGFFTTGYNYLIQVIPVLIVAPAFMNGSIEFGVITQSTMAFAHLLGAFSLIVTQFQSISSYFAVLARLSSLGDATRQLRDEAGIEIVESSEGFAFQELTLHSPRDGRTLVDQLTLEMGPSTRLLIRGSNETAKIAIFRASAGIWKWGKGRVLRPGNDQVLFLPERPYLPPGTLRELLVRTGSEHQVADEEILETLRLLEVDAVCSRAGGLHVEREWNNILALGEQQLLAVVRLLLARPRFAFLDRIDTALSAARVDRVLRVLSDRSIAYLAVGDHQDPARHYDSILHLSDDGTWYWRPLLDPSDR